jgi:hypothetical protein
MAPRDAPQQSPAVLLEVEHEQKSFQEFCGNSRELATRFPPQKSQGFDPPSPPQGQENNCGNNCSENARASTICGPRACRCLTSVAPTNAWPFEIFEFEENNQNSRCRKKSAREAPCGSAPRSAQRFGPPAPSVPWPLERVPKRVGFLFVFLHFCVRRPDAVTRPQGAKDLYPPYPYGGRCGVSEDFRLSDSKRFHLAGRGTRPRLAQRLNTSSPLSRRCIAPRESDEPRFDLCARCVLLRSDLASNFSNINFARRASYCLFDRLDLTPRFPQLLDEMIFVRSGLLIRTCTHKSASVSAAQSMSASVRNDRVATSQRN